MSQYNSRTELALTFWILQKRWEAEGNEGYLPWKYDGVFFKGHHSFGWVLDKYEIPVSILAGVPVWIGDVAYNEDGDARIAKQDGWHKENIGNMCDFGDEEPNNYTWTPPAKVETPTKTCGCSDKMGYDCLSMSGNEKKTDYTYTWDSPTLVKGDLGYLKQVRNQVREECAQICESLSSRADCNDCAEAIRAAKEK